MSECTKELFQRFLETERDLVEELCCLSEEELNLPIAGSSRARNIRQVLMQTLHHATDHAVHTVKTRSQIEAPRNEVNLLVGDILAAHGQMLGQALGLAPETLEKAPQGEWSVRQILEHVIEVDHRYMERVREARKQTG